jgi:putative ABC transport system permease protein
MTSGPLGQMGSVPTDRAAARRRHWVEPLCQDFRFSLRALWRSPRFVLVVLATLTLGIGANVAAFSLVDAVLLRPLPFGSRSDRVVTLHAVHVQQVRALGGVSYPDLLDLQARLRSFDGVAGLVRVSFTLSTEREADRLAGCYVTPELLRLLGVAPALGRHFTSADAAPPGLETTVMLTHGLWQSRFGGDASIVGRAVTINDRPHTVVGVMPQGFGFPDRAELYLPLRLEVGQVERSARTFTAVGVLKPDATVAAAQADVDDVSARLAREYPDTNRGYGLRVLSFRDSQVPRDARAMTTALMGSVAFVLLIVCANVGTLFLLRTATRRRELAVRSAIGATARRLTVLLLTEVLVLTAAGAVLGAALAAWAVRQARASWSDQLPYWVQLEPDQRMLWFVVAAAGVTAAAIASFAIFGATRQNLAAILAETAGRITLSRGTQRTRASLAAAQIGLSLALLVGAHLLIGSFLALRRADLGFSSERFLAARVNLSGDAFDSRHVRAAYVDAALLALGSQPGVAAAAATSAVPGVDAGGTVRLVTDATSGDDHVEAQSMAVTAQFADAHGLSVIDGRAFTASEHAHPEAQVAMVNERLAARLWRGESAVGKRIGLQGGRTVEWLRIVGVMPDVGYGHVGRVTEPAQLHLYVPYARPASRAMAFVVRASGDPASLREHVRRTLRQVRAGVPVFDVRTIRESRRDVSLDQEFVGIVMSGLAAMSLLLASLGVYGLVADSARQREREMAVRLVLGAPPLTITWLLLEQARRSGMAGIGLGLALAVAVAGALRGGLIAVRVFDPIMFASAAGILLAVVMVAAYVPARRASRTDPGVILRQN